MEVEEYLERKGMRYEHLAEAESKAISNFALMQALFEAQLFAQSAYVGVLFVSDRAKYQLTVIRSQ